MKTFVFFLVIFLLIIFMDGNLKRNETKSLSKQFFAISTLFEKEINKLNKDTQLVLGEFRFDFKKGRNNVNDLLQIMHAGGSIRISCKKEKFRECSIDFKDQSVYGYFNGEWHIEQEVRELNNHKELALLLRRLQEEYRKYRNK